MPFDRWIDQNFPELFNRTSYGKGILHAAVQPGLVLLNTMLAINSTDVRPSAAGHRFGN
jgi:hypothetical protein